MLSTVDLYRVRVKGVAANDWAGLFIEMPDSKQIAEALHLDLAELDHDIEHEHDQAYSLGLLLEIISLYDPANGVEIRIADVLIGTITIESIQGFGEVELPEKTSAVNADFPIDDSFFGNVR